MVALCVGILIFWSYLSCKLPNHCRYLKQLNYEKEMAIYSIYVILYQ